VRGLHFGKGAKPGEFVARIGMKSAQVVAHICNGRACIGFNEPTPDPAVEAAVQRRNDFALARLLEVAS
jgi:hypothetical protein